MILNPDVVDVYTSLKKRKHPKRKKSNHLLKAERMLNVS